MTDKEVIKAFERVVEYSGFTDEVAKTLKDALDLINRQQAEIDDLKRDTIPKLQEGLKRANKYGLETDEENKKLRAEIEHIGKLYNERTNLCEEQNRQLAELDLVLSDYPYIVFLRNGAVATKNYEEYSKLLSAISNEAIKEFADRYKTLLETELHWCECADEIIKPLDNLAKEMVGEDK